MKILKGLGICALMLLVGYWWILCMTSPRHPDIALEYETLLKNEVMEMLVDSEEVKNK